ncbi:MAG: hypothetical protein AAB400_00005 [Patescibacteria group bacterium]
MSEETIGVKQLYRSLPRIARATKKGYSFVVVKYSEPLFRIEPITSRSKEYTRYDMEKLQFKGSKTSSKDIDTILYGHSR